MSMLEHIRRLAEEKLPSGVEYGMTAELLPWSYCKMLLAYIGTTRAKALEEAAAVCEGFDNPDWPGDATQALECAAAIRSIK